MSAASGGDSGVLQLLDGPAVAVRVLEEAEPGTGRSLGPELLNIADRHASAGQFLADGVDVLDNELHTLDRARVAERQALSDHNRAGRAGRGHLHDTHLL